jgi:hypothetical protein
MRRTKSPQWKKKHERVRSTAEYKNGDTIAMSCHVSGDEESIRKAWLTVSGA